ncbi:MAG: hypothetical protein SNJ68_09450 [Cyanobacteriota bacterium]
MVSSATSHLLGAVEPAELAPPFPQPRRRPHMIIADVLLVACITGVAE